MPQARNGPMTRKEAALSLERNIIYRAFGMADRLEVDTWVIPAVLGDAFLLCSNGLWEVISDRELLEIAIQGSADAPQDVCAAVSPWRSIRMLATISPWGWCTVWRENDRIPCNVLIIQTIHVGSPL